MTRIPLALGISLHFIELAELFMAMDPSLLTTRTYFRMKRGKMSWPEINDCLPSGWLVLVGCLFVVVQSSVFGPWVGSRCSPRCCSRQNMLVGAPVRLFS